VLRALIPVLQFLAVLSAALFAGAALSINVAEHPARLGLETRMAALQWAPTGTTNMRMRACLHTSATLTLTLTRR
jgi:hypothetical protein